MSTVRVRARRALRADPAGQTERDAQTERAGLTAQPSARERRQRETRRVLREAAVRLFTSKGYAGTTVAEIADAANFSERTFYRYFASKEAVALEEMRAFIELALALVKARPPSEHPLDSILHAIDELERHGFDRSLYLDYSIVSEVPEVAGLQRALSVDAQDALTDHFAERLGVASHAIVPRLHAAAATLAFESAIMTWRRRAEAGEHDADVWELARIAVEACAHGMRRLPPGA